MLMGQDESSSIYCTIINRLSAHNILEELGKAGFPMVVDDEHSLDHPQEAPICRPTYPDLPKIAHQAVQNQCKFFAPLSIVLITAPCSS
jgi:hypothetical protein